MKKGLYDTLIDKQIRDKIASNNEENHKTIDVLDEELSSACLQTFEKKLQTMSHDDMKTFLSKELDSKEVKKLIWINDNEQRKDYEFFYPQTKFDEVALFTGALNEPTLMNEFQKELLTTDTYKLLVSFIKKSGIAPIIDDLKAFATRGGKIELITTTYMKASDFEAIMDLARLPNTTIKISYDASRTRLHAKSYLFIRNTGLNSAYIGSSNFSHPAMNRGLEWNVKLTTKNNKDAIFKFIDKFDQYWNDREFETFDIDSPASVNKLKEELDVNIKLVDLHTGIKPYLYQEHLLQQIQTERNNGNFRNLLVAATGTGKTVIAAFDFKYYLQKNPNANILFIAHRVEILIQALKIYRRVLSDYNFGELLTGDDKPDVFKNLFVTIQSIKSLDNETLKKFDYVVIDEVHHVAADSYQMLLDLEPKILLGLTATPFRTDEKDILEHFGNKPSAELNLIDAINDKMLCPFNYFGVTDSVDLSEVDVIRGKYDEKELEAILMDTGRLDVIVSSIKKYTILEKAKGIGFCCSIKHAEYMANKFNELNIKSIAITSKTHKDIRKNISYKIKTGEYQFVFTVDIFNEGIDIPSINIVLFLRPTNSPVVYIQQLGRGLRLEESKEVLTVLDFIGNNNKKFKFSNNFKKILVTKDVKNQFDENIFNPPRGCEIRIEEKARKYILENINKYSASFKYFKELYKEYNGGVSLEVFFGDNDINVEEFYSKTTFTSLVNSSVDTKKQTFFQHLIKCTDRDIIILLHDLLENKINIAILSEFEKRKVYIAVRLMFLESKVKIQNDNIYSTLKNRSIYISLSVHFIKC